MKRKLRVLGICLIAGMMLQTPITAIAEARYDAVDEVVVKTENYTFEIKNGIYPLGVFVEDLPVDANWVVSMKAVLHPIEGDTGVIERKDSIVYILTPINQEFESTGYIVTNAENPMDLSIGDLLYVDKAMKIESVLPEITLMPPVEHRGSAFEVFGEDFSKVLQYTFMDLSPYFYKEIDYASYEDMDLLNPVYGDATMDDELNIIDVIKVNKSILGNSSLRAYSSYVSDVDKNGIVDTTDSLMILKEVVEVTKDFIEK